MEQARTHGGIRERGPAIEQGPPAGAPARHGAGVGSALLGLQRSHGNRFVQRAMMAGSGRGLAPDEVVQAVADLEQVSDSEGESARLLRAETGGRALVVQRQPWATGARVGTGAVVGAGIGALLGSVVPGVGTAIGAGVGAGIGALIGGLVGYFSGPRISFSRVRAASTPAAMRQDRIPPGGAGTAVDVAIAGYDPTGPPIRISVGNSGGGNGTALVNGAAHHDLTASGQVQITGGTQTSRGHGGQLRLQAHQGTRRHARSDPFSVSAIPQNWHVAFDRYITQPGLYGIEVTNSWESDSTNLGDLTEAERSESVQPISASGIFDMGPSTVSTFKPAHDSPLGDRHGTALHLLTGPGHRVVQQTFKFNDHRSGARDVPATASGYRINKVAVDGGDGDLDIQLTTAKVPHAGTANGITSTAGAGGATPPAEDI